MKRLFRTSKPAVDPLPPPSSVHTTQVPAHDGYSVSPPPPSQPLQSPPPHTKRSLVGLMSNDHDRHRQGSVTPFPIDAGRDAKAGKVGRRVSKKHNASPPSLLEIQLMQGAENNDGEHRRDEWLASQRNSQGDMPPPRPHRNVRDNGSSPEGWSLVSAHDTHASSHGSETPTVQPSNLYLPPGARPPSPVGSGAGTPTRHVYPAGITRSQSSLANGYADMDPYAQTTPRAVAGRDRGYSSASASVPSDHESSAHSHSHSHGHGHGPNPSSMMPIPKPATLASARSPLSHSYASPELATSPPINPAYAQHPFPSHPQAQSPFIPLVTEVQQMRLDPPPEEAAKDGKEKKRFWGRGWGDKKDKKSREALDQPHFVQVQPTPPRPSGDWIRDAEPNSLPPSSQGHQSNEDDPRSKNTGLEVGQRVLVNPNQVDNVTAAIQILCAHPDPAFGSIYEVCDRLNHSSSPEQVGKEAAQALRKQFKHGNEAERRSAANLWLIMMRNVHSKGFRAHAMSKKFLAALEPILLAPPDRPLVSPATHHFIYDILSDITHNFGSDKGGEALVELWKKVKQPQDPDYGKPLPTDANPFNPQAGFDGPQAYPASVPVNQPVPRGPGYTALPSHNDDIRHLIEDCTAAKESARVLAEALIFTRPDELEHKPIIGVGLQRRAFTDLKEFYRKCFRAHEHLTGQIDWAQAEANQSRERVLTEALLEGQEQVKGTTMEEQALAALFEAHGALAEALQQHDELERLARDEQEMREVRERSKKDTKMDRSDILLAPDATVGGSTSRSASPAPQPLPSATSPRAERPSLPVPPFGIEPVRTPSPERMHRRVLPQSPGRAASPLSKTRGPRPLPIPFKTASSQSLSSLPREVDTHPSRSGTGSTNDSGNHADADEEGAPPAQPSRKALGKRRAIEDPDNKFNPDDLFSNDGGKESSASSEESISADIVYTTKPVKYAYDAYQEKLEAESSARSRSGTNTTNSEHATRIVFGDDSAGVGSHAGTASAA